MNASEIQPGRTLWLIGNAGVRPVDVDYFSHGRVMCLSRDAIIADTAAVPVDLFPTPEAALREVIRRARVTIRKAREEISLHAKDDTALARFDRLQGRLSCRQKRRRAAL